MEEKDLQEKVAAAAEALEVPGVSVGVYHDGAEHYAFHGVTSVENPLTVDEHTIFQFGSTGKTFTATAIMRLVDQGKVKLDEPVRTYLPDFKVKDESVAGAVTVLQLLNHTAGWSGDMMENTGEGDDALDRYVAKMADLEQVTPLGSTVSYNNASLSVAGKIIATITGKIYEEAIKELLFVPLGLDTTYCFMNEIMTRRFVVGHRQDPDGSIHVARPWNLPRGNAPAGGISSNAADQIKWARFHLGDGKGVDGSSVLSRELLDLMKQPTVEMKGSALGDYVGISWLMRDVDGVRLVGHGGTMNGQHSDFVTVPEKDFGFAILTNCGPNGPVLQEEILRWVLEQYLGVIETDPEPVKLPDAKLEQYTGRYETIAAMADITAREGWLWVDVEIKPEMAAALQEAGEDIPEQPPIPLGLLDGDGDRYVVAEGPAKGMKGYFVRGADGDIQAVHLGGRLATRTSNAPQATPA
ncbi:MAG TPA: serine hydrolase domain-containing protein [Acidimicrobiales bacterium]|nr:serine hydrolase domain-containing protein [Acidimicrobiales bacterium]